MKARILGLLADAVDIWQQREAARAVIEEDDFVAQLAASFVTPDRLADEDVVVVAVHTARLIVKHSRRDQTTVPVEGGGGLPS